LGRIGRLLGLGWPKPFPGQGIIWRDWISRIWGNLTLNQVGLGPRKGGIPLYPKLLLKEGLLNGGIEN